MNDLKRISLVAAALALVGCDRTPTIAPSPPPVVTVSKPLEKSITDYDVYTGRLEAAETVDVRAQVKGELIDFHFKEGDMVYAEKTLIGSKVGKETYAEKSLLFTIDPNVYQANLEVSEAKKLAAEANYKFANAEYERSKGLAAQSAASAREVETWLAKKLMATAEIKQSEAEIKRTKLDVGYTKIYAPITGRIGKSQVSKGNLVNTSGGDTLLATIVAVDPISVFFDVDEAALETYRERRARELGDEAKSPAEIPLYPRPARIIG